LLKCTGERSTELSHELYCIFIPEHFVLRPNPSVIDLSIIQHHVFNRPRIIHVTYHWGVSNVHTGDWLETQIAGSHPTLYCPTNAHNVKKHRVIKTL